MIIGGLDTDFRGEPLVQCQSCYPLRSLSPNSPQSVKSGQPATRTQRLINGKPTSYHDPVVLVGASESYEPRARDYHEVLDKPKNYNEYLSII